MGLKNRLKKLFNSAVAISSTNDGTNRSEFIVGVDKKISLLASPDPPGNYLYYWNDGVPRKPTKDATLDIDLSSFTKVGENKKIVKIRATNLKTGEDLTNEREFTIKVEKPVISLVDPRSLSADSGLKKGTLEIEATIQNRSGVELKNIVVEFIPGRLSKAEVEGEGLLQSRPQKRIVKKLNVNQTDDGVVVEIEKEVDLKDFKAGMYTVIVGNRDEGYFDLFYVDVAKEFVVEIVYGGKNPEGIRVEAGKKTTFTSTIKDEAQRDAENIEPFALPKDGSKYIARVEWSVFEGIFEEFERARDTGEWIGGGEGSSFERTWLLKEPTPVKPYTLFLVGYASDGEILDTDRVIIKVIHPEFWIEIKSPVENKIIKIRRNNEGVFSTKENIWCKVNLEETIPEERVWWVLVPGVVESFSKRDVAKSEPLGTGELTDLIKGVRAGKYTLFAVVLEEGRDEARPWRVNGQYIEDHHVIEFVEVGEQKGKVKTSISRWFGGKVISIGACPSKLDLIKNAEGVQTEEEFTLVAVPPKEWKDEERIVWYWVKESGENERLVDVGAGRELKTNFSFLEGLTGKEKEIIISVRLLDEEGDMLDGDEKRIRITILGPEELGQVKIVQHPDKINVVQVNGRWVSNAKEVFGLKAAPFEQREIKWYCAEQKPEGVGEFKLIDDTGFILRTDFTFMDWKVIPLVKAVIIEARVVKGGNILSDRIEIPLLVRVDEEKSDSELRIVSYPQEIVMNLKGTQFVSDTPIRLIAEGDVDEAKVGWILYMGLQGRDYDSEKEIELAIGKKEVGGVLKVEQTNKVSWGTWTLLVTVDGKIREAKEILVRTVDNRGGKNGSERKSPPSRTPSGTALKSKSSSSNGGSSGEHEEINDEDIAHVARIRLMIKECPKRISLMRLGGKVNCREEYVLEAEGDTRDEKKLEWWVYIGNQGNWVNDQGMLRKLGVGRKLSTWFEIDDEEGINRRRWLVVLINEKKKSVDVKEVLTEYPREELGRITPNPEFARFIKGNLVRSINELESLERKLIESNTREMAVDFTEEFKVLKAVIERVQNAATGLQVSAEQLVHRNASGAKYALEELQEYETSLKDMSKKVKQLLAGSGKREWISEIRTSLHQEVVLLVHMGKRLIDDCERLIDQNQPRVQK